MNITGKRNPLPALSLCSTFVLRGLTVQQFLLLDFDFLVMVSSYIEIPTLRADCWRCALLSLI
jgi:hypothetical protein